MKLLRFALEPEQDEQPSFEPPEETSLKQALEQRFKIPESLHTPILALALMSEPAGEIDFDAALQRIQRHVRSIGYFGPGFGAVIAKYGGNAEIAQVACRAQAVGGGVYLLGHGIDDVKQGEDTTDGKLLRLRLSDGTPVRCRCLVGSQDELPKTPSDSQQVTYAVVQTLHSISIVGDPLKSLFPATSESGPVPAAAIVLVDDAAGTDASPIYLQVHSEDTGECPTGQCEYFHPHLHFDFLG